MGNVFKATGLICRSHILSNMLGDPLRTGVVKKDLDGDAEEMDAPSEAPAELLVTTQMYNEWKCSYLPEAKELRQEKRRAHLIEQWNQNVDYSRRMPEGCRHRAPEELIRRALANGASAKARYQA